MTPTKHRWTVLLAAAAVIASATLAPAAPAAPAQPAVGPELLHTRELADEPTIGVDPHGRIFYQAWSIVTGETPVLISGDQGASWARVPSDVGGTTGHAGAVHGGQRIVNYGDPRVTVDPLTGRVYRAGVITGTWGIQHCGRLQYSDDAGRSWSAGACSGGYPEYQRIVIGPAPSGGPQPTGYPNIVYWCGQSSELLGEDQGGLATANRQACAASLDGGETFEPFGAPYWYIDPGDALRFPCGGVQGRPVVGPDGALYMPGAVCTRDPGGNYTGVPGVTISRDGGRTWLTRSVPGAVSATEEVFPGQRTPDGHVAVAVTERWLALAWIDGSDNQPRLGTSLDGGMTWTTTRVPAASGAGAVAPVDTAQPVIASSGDRLAVAFVGGDATGDWRGYLTITADVLSAALTTYIVPGGPLWTGGNCGHATFCGTNGEFMDAVMSPDGTVYAAMTTGCGPYALNGGAGCANGSFTGEGVVVRMRV